MKIIFFLVFLFAFLRADVLKENYVVVDTNISHPSLTLDFESDNLDQFIELDSNDNGLISWSELKDKKDKIIELVLPHITITSHKKSCSKKVTNFTVHRRVHQSYILLDIDLDCKIEKDLLLHYDLFFDVDRVQKLFVQLKDKNSSNPMVISVRKQDIKLDIENESLFKTFINFLVEGIWHIWIGYDHILFLLMLLIPSVIYYMDKKMNIESSLKSTLIKILKIVTAFTIAHSITLALSVLDLVDVNSRYIEVSIALSVLFTALNNLFLFIKSRTWMLAFLFGLIHGFGFASVLKEMTLKSSELVGSLLGFNLGVEIGQMAIVLVLIPLIYFTRGTKFYRYILLYGFSIVTAIISSVWAYERYFDLNILPF